jgi:hypothetical protein
MRKRHDADHNCPHAAGNNSSTPVAVGTAIADRPPHRSARAALPHTALTLDDGVEACFTSRTPRNPWDTDFPLCVGLVWSSATFSLVRALPSTPSAEARNASLFGSFIGTTARSDPSTACMSGVRHIAFPDRPPILRDTAEVSRFSCMLFLMFVSERAGFSDYAGSGFRSRITLPPMLPSRHSQGAGHPNVRFSKLHHPAHQCLCLRFASRLATAHARLEVRMESLLLSCRALASPTTCRFIPAHG